MYGFGGIVVLCVGAWQEVISAIINRNGDQSCD